MSDSTRYSLVRPISVGGAGRVWLAEDSEDAGRPVVVKRLRSGVDVEILSREYDALRGLSHPHVAEVYDFRRDAKEGAYLVEQYIDGRDLVSAASELSIPERWRLLVHVLRALEYVHARGVIHGDISPANVLVTEQAGARRACLIDFGLAARTGAAQHGHGGTIAYIAPEVLREEPIAPTSDLYSFGVLAYEVLTGAHPFAGQEAAQLIESHLRGAVTPPTALAPHLPAPVDRALLALLEKSPLARPQSARQALADLSSALGVSVEEETTETLEGYLRSARLVGRDDTLAALSAVRSVVAGRSDDVDGVHLVWLQGPEGAGRTRLIDRVAGDARIDGARVVVAGGGEAGLAGVGTWLRGLGQSSTPWTAATDRFSALELALRSVLEAVGDMPVLLCLDDGERVSGAMLDFLRVLVSHVDSTYAPGALEPTPRLGLVVASSDAAPVALASRTSVRCEELSALNADDLSLWLQRLLPRTEALPPGFLSAVQGLTEGWPGHVVSLVRSWSAHGLLSVRDGALVVDDDVFSAALPASLDEALATREAALDVSDREVLDVLRVLERPAPASIVGALWSGRSAEETRPRLARLVERGFVTPVEGPEGAGAGRYRSSGGALRVEPERRRALHASAARALMAMGGRQVVPGFGMSAVATHAYQAVRAGESRLAAAGYRAALAAVYEARESNDLDDEVRLLALARELAPEAERSELSLRLGLLHARGGDHDSAQEDFDRVLSQVHDDPSLRQRATVALAGVYSDRGEHPKALELVASLDGADARVVEARASMHTGDYDRAASICEATLATKPESEHEAELRSVLALVYYYTERMEQALPQFQAAAAACRAAGDGIGEARAVNGGGLIYHRRGDFERALEAYSESLDIALRSGERRRVAVSAMNIGTILHETGRLPEAIERYRESLRASELCGDAGGVAKAASNLGNLLSEIGVLQEAEWWLTRSTDAARPQQARLLLAYNQALRGRIRHMQNDLNAARADLTAAVSELREMGAVGEAGELFIELGMVARSNRDAEGMEHFAAAVEQASKSSGADKQLAWVEFLRGEAQRLRGASQEAQVLLREALTRADRTNLQELGWRCEAGLGRIYREIGNPMEARARFRASSERLLSLAGRLDGRLREAFLAVSERATALEEARLAMSDAGVQPSAARESQEQLMRLMEINRRLASERDPQRLLEFILDSAVQLTGAERGFIILKGDDDEAADTFDVRAARNIDQESLRRNRGRVSRSITRDVLESGEPIITVDAGEDARYRHAASVHHLKLRSILCFPLRSRGRVVGAIYLDNRFQASTFSERDLDLIGAFGDQAAVAIENAWLFEENDRTRRELEESHARVAALNAELQSRLDDQAARLAQVETSLERQRTQLETRYSYDNIIGSSPAMQRVFNVLDRVTETSVPVLVQGESGTGKELVARAIHYNGPTRRERSFVSVNCAALTETLLESELFGHVKGAFTGADRDRKGLFEVADGGTLFLDEVADMSLGMQAKLLRALQEGEVWPVGARRAIRVDVRIVAACNRDLAAMVEAKEFRQDLYFRLNVVKIILPPLRTRGDDLVRLAQHFLTVFREKHGREVSLTQGALDLLTRFSWPGNVRELEATLMNACLFCDGDMLTEAHFAHKPELFDDSLVVRSRTPGDAPSRLGGELLDLGNMTLRQIEERAILASLDRSDGNKVEAARRLGITRQTLYNKLKVYGIEVRRRIRRS